MWRWSLEYAWLTLKHKWFVFLACRRVGVSLWQALVHDLSKFTPAELPAYGRQFFGDKGDPDGFASAWLHHQNVNPHHWEYWIPRSGHSKGEDGPAPLPMPEKYVREMVADWMGASRAYTGSWEMHDWLYKNMPKMRLHQKTKCRIFDVLQEIGEVGWEHAQYLILVGPDGPVQI